MSDEPFVSYSVRDILARIEGKLDNAMSVFSQRLEDVKQELVQRAERAEARISGLETELEHRKAKKDDRRFLITAVTAAVIAIGTVLTIVHPW